MAAAPTAHAQVLIDVTGAVADSASVAIDVHLHSSGLPVGGTQNDILFDTRAVRLASTASCRINPEIGTDQPGCESDPIVGPCKTFLINLASCANSPTPPGCEGQPAAVARLRVIIAATAIPNVNPLPESTLLYSCNFEVVDRSELPALLRNQGLVAATPLGARIAAAGSHGFILADSFQTPPAAPATSTPIASATPTPTYAPLPLGEFCLADGACESGFCTNARCCEASDCGAGRACNVPEHAGSCAPVPPTTTPLPSLTASLTPTVTRTPSPQPQGFPCAASEHCSSGFCLGGTCCSTASCDANQFCNVSTAPGVCSERAGSGECCNLDSDCGSGNCAPDHPRAPVGCFGACGGTRTPTPRSGGEPNATPTRGPDGTYCSVNIPGACASGFCVDDRCCHSASCVAPDRCDIFGFEGNCLPPRQEGERCEKNTDCLSGLICRADDDRGRLCIFRAVTPTIDPGLPPTFTVGPTVWPSREVDDSGCAIDPTRDAGAAWPLVLAGVLLIRRSQQRRRRDCAGRGTR